VWETLGECTLERPGIWEVRLRQIKDIAYEDRKWM
jgi:hypothetical protein